MINIMICIESDDTIVAGSVQWQLQVCRYRKDKYKIAVNIHEDRDFMTKVFLSSDYEYSLWCGHRIIPPINIMDSLDPNFPVIGGICFGKENKDLNHLVFEKRGNKYYPLNMNRFVLPFTEADSISMDAVFIHRTVFEEMSFPWWSNKTDNKMCEDIKSLGYKIFVSPRIVCSDISKVDLLEVQRQLVRAEMKIVKFGL